MRLGDPKLWITVLSVAVVLTLVLLDSKRTSPGPLSAPHAQVPELASSEGCDQCHGGLALLGGGLSAACRECHGEIADQLVAASGLHGTLEPVLAADCASCHSEHLGAELELAGARAFQLAGHEREAFAHDHVEFALAGVHVALECAACHEQADVEVLAPDTLRFLGLDQACESCHEDPHEGSFARGCATCHGQEQPFAALASFEHGDSFPLSGAHARPTCAECHEPGGPHAIEVVGGLGPLPPERTCAECHASPHRDPFIAAVARLQASAEGATCALCHASEGVGLEEPAFDGPGAAEPLVARAELHAGSGFELSTPHETASCDDCHGAPAEPQFEASFEDRFPGRSSRACEVCHDDPHAGQFAERSGCIECHSEGRAFAPAAFGLAEHADTALPLDGAHAALECAACHGAPDSGREPAVLATVFAGTPARCADCHVDVHAGAFDPPVGEAALGATALEAPSDCAVCHLTSSFADVQPGAFEHGLRTGFELDGAHALAECSVCHPARPEPDANGRSFGRVAEAFALAADLAAPACAACHMDVHAGAFDGPPGPDAPNGTPADCAECHTTAAFDAVSAVAFDHGVRTGMALEGAHARAECGACHGSGSEASGRTLGLVAEHYPGPSERCETCHADPHLGSFDGRGQPPVVEGRQGCARCHNTEEFALLDSQTQAASFDHGIWTGYRLEGAHGRARCTDCHARLLEPDARGRHLAPVPGNGCAACHADPHLGQFANRSVAGESPDGSATDCAACHRSNEQFDEVVFDHSRDARFALDEAHAPLACASCHVPWPLPDGREVIRYKPLGMRCIDCHDHGGAHGTQQGTTRGGKR